MKRRQVWRYTCDYCGKSNCSGGSISSHERHCTKNPARECRVCKHTEHGEQAPMGVLLEMFELDCADMKISPATQQPIITPTRLEDAADKCPACMLAAIRQTKIPETVQRYDPVAGYRSGCVVHVPTEVEFNYKERMKSLWADVNAARLENEYP